jgi:hypothetical protein
MYTTVHLFWAVQLVGIVFAIDKLIAALVRGDTDSVSAFELTVLAGASDWWHFF